MVRIITLFSLCFWSDSALWAQATTAGALLDTCMVLMKKHALNTASVDWPTVEKKVNQQVRNLQADSALQAPVSFLFESINDGHGWLEYKNKQYRWLRQLPPADDSLEKEFAKGARIQTQLLPHSVGYLRLPSMSRQKRDQDVKQLNDSLCYLLDHHLQGIIIDLRLNGGGDIHPMMLGLQALLGEGTFSTLTTGHDSSAFILKQNAFYHDTTVVLGFSPTCQTNATRLPVALLTSYETASAGEGVLIGFRGRPRTISIGVATQGAVTANRRFKLSEESTLYLAVAYSKDRTGRVYKSALQPDIYLEAVNKMNDVAHDPKVLAAIDWLVSTKR